jgi:hypothetical protein
LLLRGRFSRLPLALSPQFILAETVGGNAIRQCLLGHRGFQQTAINDNDDEGRTQPARASPGKSNPK